jgi:hypothetical protein
MGPDSKDPGTWHQGAIMPCVQYPDMGNGPVWCTKTRNVVVSYTGGTMRVLRLTVAALAVASMMPRISSAQQDKCAQTKEDIRKAHLNICLVEADESYRQMLRDNYIGQTKNVPDRVFVEARLDKDQDMRECELRYGK